MTARSGPGLYSSEDVGGCLSCPGLEECEAEDWYRLGGHCYSLLTGWQHVSECHSDCLNRWE